MGITSPSFSGGAGIVTSDKIVSADLEIDGTTIVVDETNNRVGVGTGSPSTTLDVSGGITATSGNDATGTIAVRSGNAAQYSKISMGTNGNKATIGCAGATDTFFTGVAQDDLVVRADDNNSKVHIGAGASGPAAMVVTEVANVGKVGIGTTSPGVQLDIQDTTTSSANTGGALRLSANDGAAMGDSHRLGVIEFTGAEDAGGSQTVGARIEAMTDAAWSASENGAALYFFTTDGNASQSNVLKLDSNKKATFAGDVVVNNAFAAAGASGTFGTFADGDATPSVAAGNLWKHHASTQTITMFDDGLIGQTIHVISTAAITYDVTSTNLKGGSADIVTASGDITSWFFDGTNWYLVQFMDVSADHSSIGGSGASLSGTTNNTVATVTGANALIGEANLLFDGSTLTVTGGLITKYETKTNVDYTLDAGDHIIGVDTLTNTTARTMTLPENATLGTQYIIKDVAGGAGLYNITIARTGSDLIDGQTSQVINTNYASVTLVSNGANWFIV